MIFATLIFGSLLQQEFAIPSEASSEFRILASSIEKAFAEKDFEKGTKLVDQLPKENAVYRVGFAKGTSAVQKQQLSSAIANSAKKWRSGLDGLVMFSRVDTPKSQIVLEFAQSPSSTWKWMTSAKSNFLLASVPWTVSEATYLGNLTFAKYLGLRTISKGESLSEKDINAAKRVVELTRLLRSSIQSLTPNLQVPVGASSEFHHLVIDIQNALGKRDFVSAEKLSKLLPTSAVTWNVNSAKLNSDQQGEYNEVINVAVSNWAKALGGAVEFKKITSGIADIAMSFEPELAKLPGTNYVAGAAWFFGVDSTQPKVEAVIGLKRGASLTSTLGRDVFNESQFAIGRCLGLAPSPLLGSAMGRIEGSMVNINSISQQEVNAVKKILLLSKQLRGMVQKRQVVVSSYPSLKLERESLVFSDQIQGDLGQAKMLVTNTGTAPMELELRGDCGCVTGTVSSVLAPGESSLMVGNFFTSELVGDIHHNLILKTNDPDRPIIVIPARIRVIPRAEVVFTDSNTVYLDSDAKEFIYYVHSAESKLFNIVAASVIGMPFSVQASPFDGEVASLAKQGGKVKIHGYKVIVDTSKLSARDVFGRSEATVYLRTDNPKLNYVKAQIFVQKGIVSLPESVYFGSPQGVADSSFVLIRLGRPFNILKVTADSKFLKFEVKPNSQVQPSAYTIRAIYDGKSPGHRFKGTIIVETDDPSQPTIKLPYQTSQT